MTFRWQWIGIDRSDSLWGIHWICMTILQQAAVSLNKLLRMMPKAQKQDRVETELGDSCNFVSKEEPFIQASYLPSQITLFRCIRFLY